MKSLSLLLLVCLVFSVDPPIYDFPYFMNFETSYPSTNTSSLGQIFYDPVNNRQRIDRTNGKDNAFCGAIMPFQTPCVQYTVNDKLWLVYPQRYQCCFCCDSQHGCGMFKSDWLKDAQYKGVDRIDSADFDKWEIDEKRPGVLARHDKVWVSKDSTITPRRIDLNGKQILNFKLQTFKKQSSFASSIFALPPYCSPMRNCPLDSICGTLRSKISTK